MADPDVIVDASNIAYVSIAPSAATDSPSWRNVAAVIDAWCRDNPDDEVLAVADASLRYRLPKAERHDLRRAEESGVLEYAAGDADDTILELAFRHDAAVVTLDGFRSKRREYPQIQGSNERFWRPEVRAGVVTFKPRRMGTMSEKQIEEALRKDLKKATGAESVDLTRRYRCTNQAGRCAWSGTVLPAGRPPLFQTGRPVCPSCKTTVELVDELAAASASGPPLEDPPPRTGRAARPPVSSRSMVILARDSTLADFEIVGRFEVGSGPTQVGRRTTRPGVVGVTEHLSDQRAREISRRHVEISCTVDGTIVARHVAPRNHSFRDPSFIEGLPQTNRLKPGTEYSLADDSIIVLSSGFVAIAPDTKAIVQRFSARSP